MLFTDESPSDLRIEDPSVWFLIDDKEATPVWIPLYSLVKNDPVRLLWYLLLPLLDSNCSVSGFFHLHSDLRIGWRRSFASFRRA
jgi:hypothetical protein